MEFLDYDKYFDGFKKELENLKDTTQITNRIKLYTKKFFEKDTDKKVFYSDSNTKEFMYDISVLTFDPINIIEKTTVLNQNINKFKAFLLLESELGGTSASGPKDVFKNSMQDFSKLLIGNSPYKIMIMGLSPYSDEKGNFIENRIKIIEQVYKSSDCNSNIGLIIIYGNHKGETSRQLKLETDKMHFKLLEK